MSEGSYRSAYVRPTFSPNGTFVNFQVNIEPAHVQNGYWRFTVENDGEDDLRAYHLGFYTPEQVLSAALNDEFNRAAGISLTWHPGQADTFQIARSGAARDHIRTITEERSHLRRPTSFQGHVPVYPVDTSSRLLALRQRSVSGNGPLGGDSSEPDFVQSSRQSESFNSPHSQPLQQGQSQYTANPCRSPGFADGPNHRQLGSSNSQSPALPANVNPRTGNNPSPVSATKSVKAQQALIEVRRAGSSSAGQIPRRYESQRIHASSAATIPFQKGTAVRRRPVENQTQSSNGHFQSHGVSLPALRNPLPVPGTTACGEPAQNGGSHAWRPPASLRPTQGYASTGTHSSPYTSPRALPYASPYSSAYHMQDSHNPVSPRSPYGAIPTPPTVVTGQIRSQGAGSDRSKQLPASSPASGMPKSADFSSDVASTSAIKPTLRKTVSSQSFKQNLFEPTASVSSIGGCASASSLPNPRTPRTQSPVSRVFHSKPSDVEILQVSTEADNANIASPPRPPSRSPSTGEVLKKPKVISKAFSKGNSVRSESVRKESFSIPLEVSWHGARYDPNDLFVTKIMPLSEAVPCMDCGGSEHHECNCYIANLLPTEEPNALQVRDLAEMTEKFDPEHWREHHVQPPPSPETETAREKIPGLAAIVRNEESYKNDPDLQGLPEDALPLLWELNLYPNGEFRVAPGFEHLWGDGGSEEGTEGTEKPTEEGTKDKAVSILVEGTESDVRKGEDEEDGDQSAEMVEME